MRGVEQPPDRAVETAAAAFETLSDPFRLRVLCAVAAADGPARFSELRTAVEEPDTGRFNYHLSALCERFVVETEAGYRPTVLGQRVASGVTAGRFGDPEPVVVDATGRCRACGAAALAVALGDDLPVLRCRACGAARRLGPFPPSGWRHRPPEAVPRALSELALSRARAATRGVCHDCGGSVAGRRVEDHRGFEQLVVFDCGTCTSTVPVPYGVLAWLAPRVQAAHTRAGEPYADDPYWALPPVADPDRVTVTAAPFRAVVQVPLGDRTAVVAVDATHTVCGVRVSDRVG